MIASINKRIRRLVASTEEGDLIVDLLPGGSLSLGIKGGKSQDRQVLNLLELYQQCTHGVAPNEAETAHDPSETAHDSNETVQPPAAPLTAREIECHEALTRIRTRAATMVFHEDSKVDYQCRAKFDQLLLEELQPVPTPAVD